MTMSKDEAREKFGRVAVNDEGVEQWQAERSKLRGIILRFARAREEIVAPVEEHDSQYYIDRLWEWLQDKMGEGFGGVFRNDEMSPSGRFDRVTKDGMARLANHMYGAHEEFTELIDEEWVYSEPDGGEMQESVEMYERFKDEDGLAVITQFFEIEWKESTTDRSDYKRGIDKYPSIGDPKPAGFKEAFRKFSRYTKTIRSESDEPNAEDFVKEWIEWLNRYVQGGTYHIVDDDNHYRYEFVGPPETEQVVEWARQLWQDDEEFRNNVRQVWNNFEETEHNEDSEKEDSLGTTDRGGLRHENKKGQQNLGDY